MRIFVKAAAIVIFVAAGILLVSSFVSQAHGAEVHAKKPYWSKYHKGDFISYVEPFKLKHGKRSFWYVEVTNRKSGRVDASILRPCKYEDSENCYWDAGKFGNGVGRTFVHLNHHTFYLVW